MVESLRSLFCYEPETGRLYWRSTGKDAGYTMSNGYVYVRVCGVKTAAHRICWAVHYGKLPENYIDHINHDKADNRISNLREATREQNMRNRPRQSNNKTGYKGVSFYKRSRKFRAQIKVDGVRIHLGFHESPEAAYAAYSNAALMLHGEFACVE